MLARIARCAGIAAVTLALALLSAYVLTAHSGYASCGPHCQAELTVVHGLPVMVDVHG